MSNVTKTLDRALKTLDANPYKIFPWKNLELL